MTGLSWKRCFVLAALCAAAYAPAFDNGFIADDYHNLEYARQFRDDPAFLYTVPPQNFRMTTFLFLATAEGVFGPRPEFFYAFPVMVHFLNCLLLWLLLLRLERAPNEAFMAAVLFAVFQAPQEATMWLSASAEAMLGTCALATLLFWVRDRPIPAAVAYAVALFTKESAPVILLFVVLIDWMRGERRPRPAYLWLALPTLAFGVAFVGLSVANPMVREGLYELGPQAGGVLVRSLHRLVWPWLYILVLAHRWIAGRWLPPATLAGFAGTLGLAMLPYIFVTYTNALPSRHVYLASMVLAAVMAGVVSRIPGRRFGAAFTLAFVAFNVSYLWTRKDRQYEQRAAPTTALVEVLRSLPPTPVMIFGFAYPYPIIAKAAADVVPGWSPAMIGVDGVDPPCPDCVELRWNPESESYSRTP